MEVKFDYEIDPRFGYKFSEDSQYLILDTARDAIKLFLSPLESEIDKHGGEVVIIVSDKIDVLKNMNIEPIVDYNDHFPQELKDRIKEELTHTRVLEGIFSSIKGAS